MQTYKIHYLLADKNDPTKYYNIEAADYFERAMHPGINYYITKTPYVFKARWFRSKSIAKRVANQVELKDYIITRYIEIIGEDDSTEKELKNVFNQIDKNRRIENV